MSTDFWLGVGAGVVGLAAVAGLAGWFRRRLSEFLSPSRTQKVVHSTDRSPFQVLMASLWAGLQILIALVVLGVVLYAIAGTG